MSLAEDEEEEPSQAADGLVAFQAVQGETLGPAAALDGGLGLGEAGLADQLLHTHMRSVKDSGPQGQGINLCH